MDNYLYDLKVLVDADDTETPLLETLIRLSERKILRRLYPYDTSKKEVPEKYYDKVIEIAIYLYNKRGAEGQTSHSENGISRSYGSADIPDDMVKDIVPFVGVI